MVVGLLLLSICFLPCLTFLLPYALSFPCSLLIKVKTFILYVPFSSAGLKEVIIYSSPDDKKKNRGFCFLEYESHKSASLAKRRLETGRVKVWSCDIIVDWADPQEEPDSETMSQVNYKLI